LRSNLYTTIDQGKSNALAGGQEKGPSSELDGPSNLVLGSARDAAKPRDGLTHQIIFV
jgi:hypothetical protein